MTLQGPQRTALEKAISPDRLHTYRSEAASRGCDHLDLYVWDRDTAAAAMADIAILEVAMRNAMNDALARLAGRPDWYSVELGLDDRSLKAVAKAWVEVPPARRTPGRVVAQLMFGFWRNLLEVGGHYGAGPRRQQARYETLWVREISKAFPGGRAEARTTGGQFTRAWTLGVVKEVHALRNRAAHHEPLVKGFPMPGENRRLALQQGLDACLKLSRLLDRDLAGWLSANSQLAQALTRAP
ncbi:hypothetical protein AB0J80_09900 [Actinoplanes sp. NPDC049548]|uniref:hypothetical protein n=1 Tax=Actinoplanes sp. NPDC049548 TaxID=3155152 RepID=UPI003421387C